VQRVYQLAHQRKATDDEVAAALPVIQKYGLPAFCRAILNSNELLFVE
jgi:hypothetical protein